MGTVYRPRTNRAVRIDRCVGGVGSHEVARTAHSTTANIINKPIVDHYTATVEAPITGISPDWRQGCEFIRRRHIAIAVNNTIVISSLRSSRGRTVAADCRLGAAANRIHCPPPGNQPLTKNATKGTANGVG